MVLTGCQFDVVQQAMPLVQHLGKVIETAVMEMEDLVLGLTRRNDQLTGCAVFVVEEQPKRSHLAEIYRESGGGFKGQNRRDDIAIKMPSIKQRF